jgi:muconate cycloisomerase
MVQRPHIISVETFLVDLPTIRPHKLAMTPMRGQTLMLVRIHSSTAPASGSTSIGHGAKGAPRAPSPRSLYRRHPSSIRNDDA